MTCTLYTSQYKSRTKTLVHCKNRIVKITNILISAVVKI